MPEGNVKIEGIVQDTTIYEDAEQNVKVVKRTFGKMSSYCIRVEMDGLDVLCWPADKDVRVRPKGSP